MPDPKLRSERFIRLPGIYRRFEIERVIGTGVEFRIEPAGCDCEGGEFFAIYRRESVLSLSELVPHLRQAFSSSIE